MPAVLVSLNVIVAKEPDVVERLALPALLELRNNTAPLLVMVEAPAVLLSWKVRVAAAALVICAVPALLVLKKSVTTLLVILAAPAVLALSNSRVLLLVTVAVPAVLEFWNCRVPLLI